MLFGCSSAVIAGADAADVTALPGGIGLVGISLAFGISIVAVAYGLGAISGAHLNPAVSLGALLAGRMEAADFGGYVVAQVIGAIIGAGVLYIIASGSASWGGGMGTNGYCAGYLGEYSLGAALVFEALMTFIFVTVILGATGPGSSPGFAGLAIGLTLTLTAIHLVGIRVTGVSVNPARSIRPARFVGGTALSQLWVFIVPPLVGGALAGILNKARITRAA